MSLRKEMEATPIVGELVPVDCKVNHPAWPAKVFVRTMRGSDRRKYDNFGFQVTGGKELGEDDVAAKIDSYWALKPFLVCLCLVGEDGARLFEDGDEEWIEANLSGSLIAIVSDAAAKLNKLTPEEVVAEQKNSESGTPSNS